MGVLVWSPLSQGWLTGKVRAGGPPPDTRRASWNPGVFDMSTDENQRRMDAVTAPRHLADEAGVSLIHLALAFRIDQIVAPGTDVVPSERYAAADPLFPREARRR